MEEILLSATSTVGDYSLFRDGRESKQGRQHVSFTPLVSPCVLEIDVYDSDARLEVKSESKRESKTENEALRQSANEAMADDSRELQGMCLNLSSNHPSCNQ